MKIYENIKKSMEKQKIKNLRQLSLISGVPYTTLMSIRDKKMDIRVSTARKLAEALNISVDELIR